MEPQEVQTDAEPSKAKGDSLAGEGPESAEGGRPPDGTAGETKQESQDGSDQSPPLQNGAFPQCAIPGGTAKTMTDVTDDPLAVKSQLKFSIKLLK